MAKCYQCGKYMPYNADINYPGLCASCVSYKKQDQYQQEMLRRSQNMQPSSNRYPPHQWSFNDLIGAFYLFFIFFVGGGIWVSVEEMFGDTGFIGFVLSMVAGFLVLAGIGGLFTYLNQKNNQ